MAHRSTAERKEEREREEKRDGARWRGWRPRARCAEVRVPPPWPRRKPFRGPKERARARAVAVPGE